MIFLGWVAGYGTLQEKGFGKYIKLKMLGIQYLHREKPIGKECFCSKQIQDPFPFQDT